MLFSSIDVGAVVLNLLLADYRGPYITDPKPVDL